jgi:signal peptide peptidase SppA
MTSINVPDNVRARACYQQLGDLLAIEPSTFNNMVNTINSIGVEKLIEKAMEMGPYPVNTPAVYDFQAPAHPGKKKKEDEDDDGKAQVEGEDETQTYGPPPYVVHDGTAIIPVSGPLSKHPTSLGHIFGGSSTAGMRKAISLAESDPGVERIMFHIDSPGGSVAGTGDLADDIYNSSLPTAAYVEDLGASAAYWIASQVDTIYASPHAEVGSIGVIMGLADTSKAYEGQGVKVHYIHTGKNKARGGPGKPITEDDLSYFQDRVEQIHEQFVGAVARGRGIDLSKAESWGDASLHRAPKALRMGMIDKVGTFGQALEDMTKTEETTMGIEERKWTFTANNEGTLNALVGTNATGGEWTYDDGTDTGSTIHLNWLKDGTGLKTRPPHPKDKMTQAEETLKEESLRAQDKVSKMLGDISSQMKDGLEGINDTVSSLKAELDALKQERAQEKEARVDALREEIASELGVETEALAEFTTESQLEFIRKARRPGAKALGGQGELKDADSELQSKLAAIRENMIKSQPEWKKQTAKAYNVLGPAGARFQGGAN